MEDHFASSSVQTPAVADHPSVRSGAWFACICAVMIIGLVYFPREYPSIAWWESVYVTLRLFVFEYDLPHFPQSRPLIFILFAAPAISLSAVWSVINGLFNQTPAFRTRWLVDHVVVCGVGRTGKLIASTLKQRKVSVVGVDVGPPAAFAHVHVDARVPMVYGNFYGRVALRRAGARRARSIVFATGDDLVNLEGTIAAYAWLKTQRGRPRLIWAHIADEKLAATARIAIRTSGRVGIRFFDTYHIAAARVVAQFFPSRTRQGISEVTVVGFGKFGRDLVEVLGLDLVPDDRFSIRIIDKRNRRDSVLDLATELGIGDRVSFIHADIHDLRLVDEADKAFFLCTDDDLGNLTGALMLASQTNARRIYVRMANWPLPAIAEHLGDERGVTFMNINQLVIQGLEDLPGIFRPTSAHDLEHGSLGRFA
jgi:voltage-gated potassium channel Kch